MRSGEILRNQAASPTTETATLLNRWRIESEDGWILLAPVGEHPHQDGLQRITDEVVNRMVANWEADGRPQLPIDLDHRTYTREDDTESAGWLQELAAREDGLYGRVRWSDLGESVLQGGRYRQLSPVWTVRTATSEDHGKTRVVEPERLLNVALTNQPNLQGLPYLSNSRGPAQPNHQSNRIMKEILKALGLKEGATEQEAVKAITDLQARENRLQNRCTTLEEEAKGLRNAQVEADLKAYQDVITDKDSTRELLLANRDATVRILESARSKAGDGGEVMANRRPPETPGSGAGNPKPLAQRQAEAVEQIRLSNRCSFSEAWDQARRQKPELFANPETEEVA